MTRLLRVEAARLFARRAVLVLVGVAILVPTAIAIVTIIDTRQPSDAQIQRSERQAAREAQSPGVQRQVERCLTRPDRFGVATDGDVESACREMIEPQAEWYLYWNELDLAEQREAGAGMAVVAVLTILMVIAGTTFAGHDWASGSMSNQLLFEPRRLRVWGAKAVVVAATTTLLAGVVVTLFWLALGWVASSRDLAVGDGVLLDCLQAGWRGALLAGGCALGAYALTMLFRSTVAALGILLALAVAGTLLLAVFGVGDQWNPAINFAAVLLDGVPYWDEGPCAPAGSGICGVERTLTLGRGATYLGTLLVLACAASLVSFQRRDVP